MRKALAEETIEYWRRSPLTVLCSFSVFCAASIAPSGSYCPYWQVPGGAMLRTHTPLICRGHLAWWRLAHPTCLRSFYGNDEFQRPGEREVLAGP